MSKRKTIVDELRAAIRRAEKAGVTRYRIAKAAGITQIMLARFADGTRGIKLETAAKIAEGLKMSLTLSPKRVVSEHQ